MSFQALKLMKFSRKLSTQTASKVHGSTRIFRAHSTHNDYLNESIEAS